LLLATLDVAVREVHAAGSLISPRPLISSE
jgi:hypothetical protein